MANKTLVFHQNAIGHEISESLENYGDDDRKIYCKRLHVIKVPTETDCKECPYMAGWMQGHGHECAWEDVVGPQGNMRYISHKDVNKELLRVSQLIDAGILKKG